jgi:RNA polymerase sigma-70 factor (ECF subfamily)
LEKVLEVTITRRARQTTFELQQEQIWIDASRAGDVAAFNRLVLKWEQKIYNLALRMLQNPDDAAETTQEIFLAAFRNISRFKKQARFSTWLYRIAVNHCITRLRRRPQMHYSIDSDETDFLRLARELTTEQRQEEEVFRSEKQRRILDSLAFLTSDQRAVIELKFYQEETFEGISQILDIPQSTVKSRFYSALDHLKNRLGRFAEEAL